MYVSRDREREALLSATSARRLDAHAGGDACRHRADDGSWPPHRQKEGVTRITKSKRRRHPHSYVYGLELRTNNPRAASCSPHPLGLRARARAWLHPPARGGRALRTACTSPSACLTALVRRASGCARWPRCSRCAPSGSTRRWPRSSSRRRATRGASPRPNSGRAGDEEHDTEAQVEHGEINRSPNVRVRGGALGRAM